jgi:hypothetical protein
MNEDNADTTRFFPTLDETRKKREQNAQCIEIVGDPGRSANVADFNSLLATAG